MKINKLFEKLQDETFSEDLNGEFILEGNCIIWSFDLDKNAEEIEAPQVQDDDELEFNFDTTSPLELLQEAYNEDLMAIEMLINDVDEFGDWTFSDPEISDSTISFKIF